MLSPQIWCMAALTVIPTGIYYLTRGGRVSEYFSSWTIALLHMLLEPLTYLRWINLVQTLVNPFALLLALSGIILARGRNLALLAGMWLGYIAYGFFLPYQMTSHSYYHLQLVPFVALSLVPVALLIAGWLHESQKNLASHSRQPGLGLVVLFHLAGLDPALQPGLPERAGLLAKNRLSAASERQNHGLDSRLWLPPDVLRLAQSGALAEPR